MNKTCNKCGEVKDLCEFRIRYNHKNGKEYIFPAGNCRDCEHIESAENHKKRMSNPEYAVYRKAKVSEHCKKFKQSDKYDAVKVKERALLSYYKKKESTPKSCKIYVKTCEITGKLFIARRKNKIYSDEGFIIIRKRMAFDNDWGDGKGIRECRYCGKQYDYYIEGTPGYCSDECRDAMKRARASTPEAMCNKRIRYGIYRGKIQRRKIQEVDPYKVFERAGWKCENCGIKTPKELRGSYNDNAPELDHIIPVSLDGVHSYTNTQCLCRKCNREKSNRLIGQLKMCI
jgi:5-methylcytosine-specific restriction endonuclease McrA